MRHSVLSASHGFALGALLACADGALANDPRSPVDGPERLDALTVTDDIGEDSYRARETTGALGTPTAPEDIPQSVSVITGQVIDDTGADRVDETLDFVSGVSRQNDFGGLWDNVAIRGFIGDINRGPVFLRDGVRANRGFTARLDTAGVERVEVLKGPASALYGRADPGGSLNIVSKRPQFEPRRRASVSGSSEQAYRGSVDLTGPIAGDRLAYRLNAAVERNDSFRDRLDEQRHLLAPALTWFIDERTRLEYNAEILRQKKPFDRGIPAIDNGFGDIPISRFFGEPADGDITLDNVSNRLRVDHRLHRDWQASVTFAHHRSRLEGFSSEAFGASVEQQQAAGVPEGKLARDRRQRDATSNDVLAVAELRGEARTGAIRHDLLFGAEASRFELDFLMRRSNPLSGDPADLHLIDLDNPRYGQAPPAFAPERRSDRDEIEHTRALYAQNLMHLGPRWRLLLGTRLDRFRQTIHNNATGERADQTRTAFSPRIGVMFDPIDRLGLYANASRSFDPNSGVDRNDRAFDPQTATSLEVGARSRLLNDRVHIDVAAYRILKENVLTTDPREPGASIAAGEVESRGVEIDVDVRLHEQFRMALGYAWTDARIQADGVDFERDTRVLNVPRHGASVLGTFLQPLAQDRRAGIGGGVVYVGERVGNQTQPEFKLPAYTTVQVHGFYDLSPDLRLQVNVHNLFDREYYRSSFFQNWVAPGAPRTVTARLNYRF